LKRPEVHHNVIDLCVGCSPRDLSIDVEGVSYMFENCRKTLPALFVSSFVAAAGSAGIATAQDSSPYLIGHWKLNDAFSDFKPPGSTISTGNTEFVFLNPTNLVLTLEYAFFGVAADGTTTFCGCDRDTLRANGRVRYTMLGEKQGGLFSTQLSPTQTDGTMKTIVFPKGKPGPTSPPGDELEAGYQIDLFGGGRTEAPLLAVPIFNGTAINQGVSGEITAVHDACDAFLGPAS
jgi:hypothetical protein